MTAEDVTILRQNGFGDRAIHDATQVIAYFNYINRVADALGVTPETINHHWEASQPSHKG
jgi:alkylhydroperoxidase family enzyme